MDSAVIVVVALGIGALLWLRQGQTQTVTAPPPASTGPSAGTGDISGGMPASQAAPGDVTQDSNGNTVPNDYMMDNAAQADTPAFRQSFVAEVYQSAYALELTDLTQDDIADAFTFLSCGGGNAGKFVRRDDLGTRYKAAIAEIQSEQASGGVASVIGDIESIIPVVGGALAAVTGSAQGALAGSEGNVASSLQNVVAVAVSPTTINNNPIVRAIMSPEGAEAELPLTQDELQTPVSLDGVQNYNGYSWENGMMVRARLLTRTPYGWLFPWLCVWFDGLPGNVNTGAEATIVDVETRAQRRGRVFRAIDLIICKAFPAPPTGATIGTPTQIEGGQGVYWWASKMWGPMLGSIFPPRIKEGSKDQGIFVDAAGEFGPVGQWYAQTGQPMQNPTAANNVGQLSGSPAPANPAATPGAQGGPSIVGTISGGGSGASAATTVGTAANPLGSVGVTQPSQQIEDDQHSPPAGMISPPPQVAPPIAKTPPAVAKPPPIKLPLGPPRIK
jgi:hypothetical protein